MAHGMQTLDQNLKELVNQGMVSYEDAKLKAADPNNF
jgi:twitching motility protein PilT